MSDEIVRIRLNHSKSHSSRNTVVVISSKGGSKKIYRLINGLSNEKVNSGYALMSYSSYAQLNMPAHKMIEIKKANVLEKYICFPMSIQNSIEEIVYVKDLAIILVGILWGFFGVGEFIKELLLNG